MKRPALAAAAAAALAVAALWLARGGTVEPLRVFAAASLTDAFREIGAAYEQAHPGERVALDFGGSQLLRTQIEQGAPADVFASADSAQMEPLRHAGLVGPGRIFARNHLVVAVSPRSRGVRALQDLARPGARVVLAGPTVPVGHYARLALARLGAVYGKDYASRVAANTVSREVNARSVLAKVLLGEADAGIVYETDARSADGGVRTLPIPAHSNIAAAYPIAVVAGSPRRRQARAFVDLVLGPRGQAILLKHGFRG